MPPEVDGLNFAPRVRVPVLMVNGRYDFGVPFAVNQVPLFRLLGSPDKDKLPGAGHHRPARPLSSGARYSSTSARAP